MDYEKKYKEALEDMMVIYPNLKGEAKLAVEHAFSELHESEDERIRKEIISALKFANDGGVYDKHIAYLEKQKESTWTDEDEQLLAFIDSLEDKPTDYTNFTQKEVHSQGYDEAYLNDCIAKAKKSWEGVDVDKYMGEVRGKEPEVDLEKEIRSAWEKCNPVDEGMGVESAYMHIEAFDIIARHFAKWGAEHLKN